MGVARRNHVTFPNVGKPLTALLTKHVSNVSKE
jgi:hypothetical protein